MFGRLRDFCHTAGFDFSRAPLTTIAARFMEGYATRHGSKAIRGPAPA